MSGSSIKHSSNCNETEFAPDSRGSNQDDITNENYRVSDATIAWDTDGSHSMKMSPGLVEGKDKHNQSPKDGYRRSCQSRSRSRSPPPGFLRESGVNDRNRMRAGGLAKPCRDFAAGKCRRGSHCHFLHDGTPRYSGHHEEGDYSLTSGRPNRSCINYTKGRCIMGASCKFVHHDNSDKFGDVSVDESPMVREIDRKHKHNSYEQGGRHVPNNGVIPCKFFASGNCRNGKNCRFSHDMQASMTMSPNRRLRDDRPWRNQGGDQALLSDSISPKGRLRNDRWGSEGNMAVVDKVWDGPKHIDLVAVSDTANMFEDNKHGIRGAPAAPQHGFTTWPMNDGWDHSLDKSRVFGESPFSSDKKEANFWAAENDGAKIRIPQSAGTDIWPGNEKMSPDWNYRARSSSHVGQEHGQNKQQVAPGQGFNPNVNTLHSSSCHVVGQSQVADSIVPPRLRIAEGMQNQEVSTEKQYIVEPSIMDASLSQIGSRNPPTHTVSKEQLAQLTSLSASLADILRSSQQLPQLCAALNSLDAKNTPFIGKTEGSGNPISMTFIKPDPPVGFQKQYDPICDSMEPKNANAGGVPPRFSPIKIIPKDAAEVPSLLSNSGKKFEVSCKTDVSEELVKREHIIQLQQGENNKVNNKNHEVVAEEKKSSGCEDKILKEDSPLGNIDQNDGPDEAKKTKDAKGIRAFKFSLVEFVKELLKPTWKGGQITKENYKAIVKKVTDKVTGTVQGAHIPQTQEKIDRYLSCSKPKLNKLIQAYVEKVQKA